MNHEETEKHNIELSWLCCLLLVIVFINSSKRFYFIAFAPWRLCVRQSWNWNR